MGLTIETLDSAEAIRAAAGPWDDLWRRSDVSLPTARAAATALWVERFGSRVRAVVVREGGTWLALLPLVGRRHRGVMPVGDLPINPWLPGGELLLDLACDTDTVCDVLLRAVRRTRWPLLWLQYVPIDSTRWQRVLKTAECRGTPLRVRHRYQIGKVAIAGTWNEFLASRSKNLRRSLRKDSERLNGQGATAFDWADRFAPEEVEPALRSALEIELRSWKADRGRPVLAASGMLDFYTGVGKQLAAWNMLRVARLEHAGRTVAFEIGWIARRVYHSYKVGFDSSYREFGPGHLLRMQIARRFFETGEVDWIDFQGPLTEALAAWSTDTYAIGRVAIATKWLGRFFLRA